MTADQPAQDPGNFPAAVDARVDTRTTTANSGVVLRGDRTAIVELHPDHPGFRDEAYRRRRNRIAQVALDYKSGTPIPDVEYTEEEHAVWRTVWDNMRSVHRDHACRAYLDTLAGLEFEKHRIPQLREINETMQELTGFRMEPVAGLVHPRVFLTTLGEGVFLSTQYIRHTSTPLYTPEPDVVHELVGHAITLCNPELAEINRLVGQVARRTGNDEALDRVSRVYWYTIEFGVLWENGALKAYGAGLLSSFGEMQAMHDAEIRPLDFRQMEVLDYDVTRYQPILFAASSFEDMYRELKAYLLGKLAD